MKPHATPTRSRREFLERSGLGFGALAASTLLQRDALGASKPPHFPAKGKSVIYLFMHGGPSHIDSFDPKTPKPRLPSQIEGNISENSIIIKL